MGWWDSEATGTPVGDMVTMAVQVIVPLAGMIVASQRAQAAFVAIYEFTYLIAELQQSGIGIG
jgi:hypothetical protein